MGADSGQRAAQERYRNGFFLAPMVRIGTLPMRLLSLQYGADLVWTSEVVDKCIIGCDRVVDSSTGVIAFVKDAKTLFTTHADERQRVIFQLGSATPAMALQAAKLVEADVSGVDLNCGCPKKFSIQGGMGAALMEDPDRLCAILEALVANLRVPVTCKIRVFDDEEQTLALVRRIAATGIAALTVHCRTRSMRPREKAMWGRLNGIVRELAPLPVILNGDVFEYADVQRAKEATGATSVMTARAAAANPSIFRAEGALTVIEAVVAYMRAAVRVGNPFQNTKYTLMQMHPDTRSPGFRAIQGAKSLEAMCAALECTDLHPAASAAVNPAASAAVNPAA
ncbi:tRNA-dihydrouridine synthase 2, partial [Coemansia biformis]